MTILRFQGGSINMAKIICYAFLCPQLQRKWWGILVSGCLSVHACVRQSVCSSRTVHARVLKFHIWIPHGKIGDTHLFSCMSYLPFWSYAILKKSEWNLMHAISYEPCMQGFLNFIYGFLMEKLLWLTHFFFFLVRVISLSGVMPLWKNLNEVLSARYLEKYLS